MSNKEKINFCSPYIESFSHEKYRESWGKEYYRRTASCYGCSRVVKELIVPKCTYEEQYENIRDVKFKCPVLMQMRKEVSSNCKIGNRNHKDRRCDHCVHGSYSTDIHLVPKSEREGRTIHRMYTCNLPEDPGYLYRGYYSCDFFELKEDVDK